LLLSGCGFHLRGTATLPFNTLYVQAPALSPFALQLKRAVHAGSSTKVIEQPEQAEAILQILNEVPEKEILSLSAGGRVREFQLRYRVGFRVHDGKGSDFVPQTTIQLTRDMTYDDTQVLAKEQEELLLIRDMQSDMVQQIIRRLAAAKQPTAKVEEKEEQKGEQKK
jgi:LPS-assembly lipoprotein